MRRITRAVLVLACLVAGTAQADILSYQCRFEGARGRDWIQPLIFIGHDTDSGRVVVSDAGILHFRDGQPVDGALTDEGVASRTFRWQVEMRSILNVRVIMNYRAEVSTVDGSVTVVARGRGQSTQHRRTGTCEVRKLS